MAALKSLLDNSNIVVNMVLTPVNPFFSFILKSWLLVCQVIFNWNIDIFIFATRFCICVSLLFQLAFCHAALPGRGWNRERHYFITAKWRWKSRCFVGLCWHLHPLLVHADPSVEMALLLLGAGEGADSPLDLFWHYFSGCGRDMYYCDVGVEVQAPPVVSTDTRGQETYSWPLGMTLLVPSLDFCDTTLVRYIITASLLSCSFSFGSMGGMEPQFFLSTLAVVQWFCDIFLSF